MKKFLPTILLVVICIGGFIYASNKSFFKKEEPIDAKQLISIKAEDVKSVSLPNGDNRIEMSRKDETTWEMQKPANVPLSSSTVDGWVNSFAFLTYTSKVDENATDLAQYQLDKPLLTYEVTMKDGTVHKLLIGKALPVAGTSYAKLEESPVVYELSDDTIQTLAQTADSFADKRALPFNYDKVVSMTVEWKGQKWALTKAQSDKSVFESTWKLGDKELKPEEGSPLLDAAIGLEGNGLPQAASAVKVDNPELKIEVKEKDGDKETSNVYVGKIADANVNIVKQGGAWAYAVALDSVQALYDQGVAAMTAPSPSPSAAASATPSASVSPSAAK